MDPLPAIPFNRPYMTGRELGYIRQAHERGHLSGDGLFSRKCHEWLEAELGCTRALLTHSGTAALEMAALLADLAPGDEVIMPSFTFVSTANAFVLRGAVPVFVDIRPDTLNLDEAKVEEAITARTRVLVPVHYAGVGCEMDPILGIAARHGLLVIEDAAQAILCRYRNRYLGTMAPMAALSFHETKNILCGEGGALLINRDSLIERAEIIREKGTNRSRFFRGEVAKYTWVDVGSSLLPSDILAAFLWAQMEEANAICRRRLDIWNRYHQAFADLEARGCLRRPVVPLHCSHQGHLYYLLLENLDWRTRFIDALKRRGIQCVFHYVPLHDSPAGARWGRCSGSLDNTVHCSERLARLPLWIGLEPHLDRIVEAVSDFFR